MVGPSPSSSASTMAENWCATELKIVKCDFVWTIKNFSCCALEKGEYLESATFSAETDEELRAKWFLRIYPHGHLQNPNSSVSLSLHLAEHNKTVPATSVKYIFGFLNAENERKCEISEVDKFVQDQNEWRHDYRFYRSSFAKYGLLPNDRLSIFCEVSVVVEMLKVSGKGNKAIQWAPNECLPQHFGALLENGLFADCVLCSSDGKEFKAHKAVLACRSPVFAAMFSNDTEEKRNNRAVIEDVKAPVLSQLLHFLYTGQASPLLTEKDMAEGLLAAADKYQLDGLKALCEKEIFRGLNKDDACAVLALADRHNAEHLKTRAIDYIKLHMDQVMASADWSALFSSHPGLVNQVIKALSAQLRQSP